MLGHDDDLEIINQNTGLRNWQMSKILSNTIIQVRDIFNNIGVYLAVYENTGLYSIVHTCRFIKNLIQNSKGL